MELRISAVELKALGKALSSAGPEVRAGVRVGVRSAGELVAVAAREKASWSTRIPATITVRAVGATAVVTAGGPSAPDAAPYEHGGNSGPFRHPVFGRPGRRWTWVAEESRPYLHPALDENVEAAAGLIADAVGDGVLAAIS